MKTTYTVGIAAGIALSLMASMTASAAPKPRELSGTWTGLEIQLGKSKQSAVALTLNGKTGASTYADQHCTGKLTRVGVSGDYSFFTETITEGKYDAAAKTGCIDGSLTLIRVGETLVMGWAAAHDGQPIIAYATLSAQAAAPPAPTPKPMTAPTPKPKP